MISVEPPFQRSARDLIPEANNVIQMNCYGQQTLNNYIEGMVPINMGNNRMYMQYLGMKIPIAAVTVAAAETDQRHAHNQHNFSLGPLFFRCPP